MNDCQEPQCPCKSIAREENHTMREWMTIKSAPKGKPILVWNGEYIAISHCHPDTDHAPQCTHWYELPEPPIKEHMCKSKNGDWLCKFNRNKQKGLILVDYRGIWEEVVSCPFCGEKK